MSSSPFVSWSTGPAPTWYPPAAPAPAPRSSSNAGVIILAILLAPVALLALVLVVCLVAVTAPVSVPLLIGGAVLFFVVRPKFGRGQQQQSSAYKPTQPRRRKPARSPLMKGAKF